jgi:hypothetical protein
LKETYVRRHLHRQWDTTPLALTEGATENATVVGGLLAGLRDRGLDTTRPLLVVLDGAKALRRAVTDVFDHPVIQRCQLHKLRNMTDRLPDAVASTVAKRMRAAYRNPDALIAQAELEALARELDRAHPGAAASLREGLAETLTIGRLGVPPTLARTLRSTDESFKAGVALSGGWDGASLNAVGLGSSGGAGHDHHGFVWRLGRLGPVAMAVALEREVAHLALDHPRGAAQPAWGQQVSQHLSDRLAHRLGQPPRGKTPPGWSPGAARCAGCG